MKKGLIILGFVVAVGAVGAVTMIGARNGLVAADEDISNAWSQVDGALQRRADLAKKLIGSAKGLAGVEQEVLTAISDAREKLEGSTTIPEKVRADQELQGALARLSRVVEGNPGLKSNPNLQALTDQLAGAANRVAAEKTRFDEVVRDYNGRVRRFPTNVAAAFFGFERKDID